MKVEFAVKHEFSARNRPCLPIHLAGFCQASILLALHLMCDFMCDFLRYHRTCCPVAADHGS